MKKNKIQSTKVNLSDLVIITKVTNDMGKEHPNKIEQGYTFEGREMSKPKVGLSYYVIGNGRAFASSMVTEVLDDNTFKTLNSTYKIEYV